jgi:formylglycine-generating enzyme required for sulfatase activity
MALCARWGAGLPAEVTAFVAASRQAARHNRLRGAANFVALPVIVALFWAGLVAWGVRTIEAEMQFVLIPNGCFQMGSPDTETERNPDEGPVHKVCLRTFELGKFEVTQAE